METTVSNHICGGCSGTKPCTDFHRDKSKNCGHTTICKPCVSAKQKATRVGDPEAYATKLTEMKAYAKRPDVVAKRIAKDRADKRKAVELYGNVCVCCGITGLEFLTFDHVGGWGAEHRSADSSATSIVKWIRRRGWVIDPRLRLLCWNCNCSRGIFGFCPHNPDMP